MTSLKLPTKLHDILYQDEDFASDVYSNYKEFLHILEKGELFFFPEYTDHSINHINGVLLFIERLISDDTFKKLLPIDIGVLVTAVVLHDIGMLTNADMFKNILRGQYDNIPENWFKDEPTWKELWKNYVKESQYWNAEKRENVTGDSNYVAKVTDKDIDDETHKETITYKIFHPLSLNGKDRRFIGEFIRRHHARLAYEIALNGYIGKDTCNFKNERLPHHFMQLAGLIARSHGMNVRDTFDILKKKIGANSWKKPNNIKVALLMSLVRIADYLQIDSTRVDQIMLNIRTMYSKYSLLEHETHLSINCIQMDNDDPERIVVQASPRNAKTYVKIERLIQDIQHEFDLSWAIIGEVYGNQYQLSYRRIITNISDEDVKNGYEFVPKQFDFKFNNALLELLYKPLYNDNPSFGVRELVQNAVDACRARMAIDKEYNAKTNFTHVTVSLNKDAKLFSIVDTGIGMNIEEIENYFLTIGSSYDSCIEWQKTRDEANERNNNDETKNNERVFRTGHFGIGILAAFLLGPKITVKTKRLNSEKGYEFTLSLKQSFIQIKTNYQLEDYGTTIEITCDDRVLELLDKTYSTERTELWHCWYVDSKPKVEYNYNGKPLKSDSFNYYNFEPLPTESSDFANIYWESCSPFMIDYWLGMRNHRLFCNGFFITNESNKRYYSIPGVEKYISPVIPSLKFTDIFNNVPLNLQRTNIDDMVEYSFEKDLAIAQCKELLCQLLVLQNGLQSYGFTFYHHFFYNQLGFVLNPHRDIDFTKDNQYTAKCLYGKKLVHVYYENDNPYDKSLNWKFWQHFISKHPEAFFSFNAIIPRSTHQIYEIDKNTKKKHHLYHYSRVVPIKYMEEYLDHCNICSNSKRPLKEVVHNAKKMCHAYGVLEADPFNEDFVNDLITQLDSISDKDREVYYFSIHNIKGNDEPSSLDDFISEYASGDMIIPYSKTEREKKFTKIYEECGEKIKKYSKMFELMTFWFYEKNAFAELSSKKNKTL